MAAIKDIFNKINQFLVNKHNEVDYFLRMGSEFVIPDHSAASNFSGCTVNSTEVKMIGNYILHINNYLSFLLLYY